MIDADTATPNPRGDKNTSVVPTQTPVRRMSAGKKYPPMDIPTPRPPSGMRPTRLKPVRYPNQRDAPRLSPLAILIPLIAVVLAGAVALTMWMRQPADANGRVAGTSIGATSTPAAVLVETPIATTGIAANATLLLPPTTQATLIPELPTAVPSPEAAALPSPLPPTSIPTAVPAASPVPTETPLPAAPTAGITKQADYTVVPGDTCGKIAKQFGVTVQAVIAANALATNCPLAVNQVLIIPPVTEPVVPTLAAQLPTPEPAATTAPAAGGSASGQVYTIKPGDTCGSIATAAGVTVEDLIKINALDASCLLRAGKTLIIP